MPDLTTHLLVAHIASRPARFPASWELPFYIGSILPDLSTRAVYIIFPDVMREVQYLHTPLGCTLSCFAISLLFSTKQRRTVFSKMWLGAMLHIALDLLQKQVGLGYALLFPFSWWTWDAGLFWPDTSVYIAFVLITVIGVYYGARLWLRHNNKLLFRLTK